MHRLAHVYSVHDTILELRATKRQMLPSYLDNLQSVDEIFGVKLRYLKKDEERPPAMHHEYFLTRAEATREGARLSAFDLVAADVVTKTIGGNNNN